MGNEWCDTAEANIVTAKNKAPLPVKKTGKLLKIWRESAHDINFLTAK